MRKFIEPRRLVELVACSPVRGVESPKDAILGQAETLIPVSDPSQPALDVRTYEVRLERWRRGEGPMLHGMEDFVSRLQTWTEPTRVVSVDGRATNYIFLFDVDLTRVIAALAIDVPGSARVEQGGALG